MDRRRLPAIHALVREVPEAPTELCTQEARALVADVRAGAVPPADWAAALRDRVARRRAPHLRRLVNATGVVLHTNLGRAPLSARAAVAVAAASEGYCNLELDLATGARGERLDGVRPLLRELTGAEDAIAVNNNASAVLLVLTALARGKEVVCSRGELVEIGGAFRVPEVVTAGGARLREVGSTNRTRASDFAAAIGPDTAVLLRVHRSNFRVEGFTEDPVPADLYALARERGIPLVDDLGSGALVEGLGEPTVRERLRSADLACFSGDKLLGGPQAGIVVGRADLVARLRKHPLYRALRLDRLVLAALEATLRGYVEGELPPAAAMLAAPAAAFAPRARALAEQLRAAGLDATVLDGQSAAGGGSQPGVGIPTPVVAVRGLDANAAIASLRAAGVIARVEEGAVIFDLRTVLDGEDAAVARAGVALAVVRAPR
jgi:L-seryl-tRNA(Ser) seleniumtransferase